MKDVAVLDVQVDTPYKAAQRLVDAGVSVIPIGTDKRPAIDRWKPFQERLASVGELEEWFADGQSGIAIVAGEVSGNIEILDFDDPSTIEPWTAMVEAIKPGLVNRLPMVKTPSGGQHIYWRCDPIEGSQKLAVSAEQKTMIETRGKGGYALIPPSPPWCHPEGKEYLLVQGELADIPTITEDERDILLNCARALTEYVEPERIYEPPEDTTANGERPGDLFAAAVTWKEILEPHEWKLISAHRKYGLWKRPGKIGDGPSATTGYNGADLLYVFSSNAAPFEPQRGYSKFTAYTLLNHGGDFKKAAAALAAAGYCQKQEWTWGLDWGGFGITFADEAKRGLWKPPGKVSAEVLKSYGPIADLVELAKKPGIFRDPEALEKFLKMDPVDRWDFNELLMMDRSYNHFRAAAFWDMVAIIGLNQDIPPLLTPVEMRATAAKPPQGRIIDQLLIRGGLTIAAADPKCGKSTLARNAVVAVLRGGEFLGRKCVPGPVIYYAMEGDQTETLQHLYQLGLDEETEELLGFRGGAIPRLRFLDVLRRDIEVKGAVLAVIDPLGDALLLKDINNYMEVNYAIKPLNDIAAKTGCHILALHHTNKNGAGGDPRSFLGSAQLAGATDCNMMLWKNGNGERFIRTEHRYVYDTPIEDTLLKFDKETGVVSLGKKLTAHEKQAMAAAEREGAIVKALQAAPGKSLIKGELYKAIGRGDRGMFDATLVALEAGGSIKRGKLGKAVVIRLANHL